ncbi:MAG TPA: PilN domain-containing protein [Vicinamibacterales bacterium]|nr:PilN domain-containing protein [Vicinamibacterales bacterium]
MIRINLLGGERQVKKKAIAFDIGQRLTLACSLILVLTAVGVGYWYYALQQQSTQLDADILRAQQEQLRLQSIIREVNQFDAQRAQLQQRVQLIEQLRSGQSIPVQMLDVISKSVPDMLWLTDLEQKGNDVTMAGNSTTLISLSDFVGNLGMSPMLQKPIEIVNSTVQSVAPTGQAASAGSPSVDLIKFTVKASLVPNPKAPPPPPAAGARAGGPAPPGGAR